jgi:hypothetical protein
MIIVGTTISDTKVKVDGCFVNGSQSVVIDATNPPNPPENQAGKENVMFLNPVTKELFWEYVDRTLTDAEQVTELNATITDLVQVLADKGVIY